MYAFTYERPATIQEASQQVANGAQALAGGQTMLAAMKLGAVVVPAALPGEVDRGNRHRQASLFSNTSH